MPDRGARVFNSGKNETESDSFLQNMAALLVWLTAGVVVFLPFALDTSPWDAVTLHVPGNQGNWWHVLVGAPFFLAIPMIWLRLRLLFRGTSPGKVTVRLFLGAAGLSAVGSLLVEVPFLLHLAGTSNWQRLSVLSLGLGILVISAILLLTRRQSFSPLSASVIAVNAAYAANAVLCLIVYSEAAGAFRSRSGWWITMIIVWPILFEILWLSLRSFQQTAVRVEPGTA